MAAWAGLIREIAKLLGYMSYGFIATKYGKLHYRHLERQKIRALAQNKGSFDAYTTLTEKAKEEPEWRSGRASD